MKPPGKECITIRSALAVVSAYPPAEEHDVLRTCLRVGPAVSERLCSWLPWRSEQQSEDTLALRGKLVQESKTGEITPISAKPCFSIKATHDPKIQKGTDLTLPSSSAPCKTMVA
jgi:hypothetical protein